MDQQPANLSPISSQAILTNTLELSIHIIDELFTLAKFLDHDRLLLGTQSGVVYLIKIYSDVSGEKSFRVITTFNWNCNFCVTGISLMPHVKEDSMEKARGDESLFAVCFADGSIKIFDIEDRDPVLDFQSMNVELDLLRKVFDA